MKMSFLAAVLCVVISLDASEPAGVPRKSVTAAVPSTGMMRVSAAQTKRRSIDWRLNKTADVLAAVDRNIDELEKIVHQAGDEKCDVLALPEDTLGLLDWYGMNESSAKEVLPVAVKRMLDRLGRAAATHRMFLVACSDVIEPASERRAGVALPGGRGVRT